MPAIDDLLLLEAARDGDQDAFARLVNPRRRELLVHCYRMLGSWEDAEDTLQETLVRAWRGLATYEGRASLRAWLYKIATNAALDLLRTHQRRVLPSTLGGPADPDEPLPAPLAQTVWIEPLLDVLLDDSPDVDPESRYEVHEDVTLAFLAALQALPGRQRAVLILRDVLEFRAAEAAEILDMSVAATNSALERARATMEQVAVPGSGTLVVATDGRRGPRADEGEIADLLARYVDAWEKADSAALVALLREDAAMTMPPIPAWYQGRVAIAGFLNSMLFAGSAKGRFRLVATRANGSPAFAVYQRESDGSFRGAALHVLTVQGDALARIDDFLAFDTRLFSRLGLALTL